MVLVGSSFVLVVVLAASISLTFGGQTKEASGLVENLNATMHQNEALREGVSAQVQLLLSQLDRIDQDFPARFSELGFSVGKVRANYLRLNLGRDERLAVETISSLRRDLVVTSVLLFEELRAGNRQKATAMVTHVRSIDDRLDIEFHRLNEIQLIKLEQVLQRVGGSVSRGYVAIVLLAGGLLVFLAAFTLILRTRILQPLNAIIGISERIRGGDFTARAEVKRPQRPDETDRLAQGVNHMAESLQEIYQDLEAKVEERTRQLEKLQIKLLESEKMAAIGELVSGVAHEVNNPLTGVMGYVELAKMGISSGMAPDREAKVTRQLDTALEQVKRCKRIVSNMLLVARRRKPQLETVDINQVVDQVLKLREYQLKTRNIDLLLEYDPAAPSITADLGQLQQLFLNLLNNAYDAVLAQDEQRTVWVRTRQVEDGVEVEIQDSGPGMADPERVFEPFFTTKASGEGTGLGLAVVKRIVHQHGGSISAENWHRGALFVVNLPHGPLADRPPAQDIDLGGELAASGGSALVVDDEPLILTLVCTYLSKLGIPAKGVASGTEAIAFLEDSAVDLILADIRMPGEICGLSLYSWVKEHRPELTARFVFVTGEITIPEAESLGLPILRKPFTFKAFSQQVQAVLES